MPESWAQETLFPFDWICPVCDAVVGDGFIKNEPPSAWWVCGGCLAEHEGRVLFRAWGCGGIEAAAKGASGGSMRDAAESLEGWGRQASLAAGRVAEVAAEVSRAFDAAGEDQMAGELMGRTPEIKVDVLRMAFAGAGRSPSEGDVVIQVSGLWPAAARYLAQSELAFTADADPKQGRDAFEAFERDGRVMVCEEPMCARAATTEIASAEALMGIERTCFPCAWRAIHEVAVG